MRNEPPPSPVSTARLADPGRGPAIVALLAVGFVLAATGSSLLAGSAGPAPRSGDSDIQVDPTVRAAAAAPILLGPAARPPSPTPEPSLRPGEIACMPAGWRLAYVGSVGSWQVETWLVVDPVVASDPLDARIPVAELGHDVVSGLGACAPPAGVDGAGRPASIQRAWRVRQLGGTAVALPVRLVAAAGPGAPEAGSRSDALTLVRPGDAATGTGWAPGEYVLEIASPAPAGQGATAAGSGWLRIQLESATP